MNQDRLQRDLIGLIEQTHLDPTQARLTAEKAILWAGRNGWVNIMALANLVAGRAHASQSAFDSAVECYQRASTLFKDVDDIQRVAESFHGLSAVYLRKGEFSLALEQLRKALTWLNRLEEEHSLVAVVRMQLSQTLMNLGYWSDAEQELLSLGEGLDVSDQQLAEYQLALLRLVFFRGDQRAVREQLQLCREMILSLDNDRFRMPLDYYSARYVCKYQKVRQGEKELTRLWQDANKSDIQILYLAYEAAVDLLQSDYPQRGIFWLTELLTQTALPLSLKQQIHLALANFFVAHLSHELANEHFQSAARLTNTIRESEINQQWARYRADDMFHELRSQLAQHKKNNQILAQSNALLQAVNRIAMAVNAALDQHSLLTRLREQLEGWVSAEIIGIGELRDEELIFDCLLDGERRIPSNRLSMSETRAWSVKAIQQGRILFDNDFVFKDEILMEEAPNVARSVAFVPLKCENRVIGLLTLQSRQSQAFDNRCISLLEYIAPVIGIAFANQINFRRTIELSGQVSRHKQELHDVRQLMAHMVDHDELTGLPNRTSLPAHFERWISQAPFHCLLIRIANLADINKGLGYGSDEDVVKILGQRLRNRLRPDDLLIRMSNDEFLLLVGQMETRESLIDFARQLSELTVQPLRAREQTVDAKPAIGIVTYPEHGETLEEVLSMLTIATDHALSDETNVFTLE
ncbi:sensor domain-containing diguanylate cyclase [Reinekea blandensis]|uniref:GGDEF domain-containing protein n=1 Tax=Reinekea blandensis MED297 TaxID=314283 RepID=A4BAQ8_9GAMM|nr:sensor domain-containing diguanylate cyclase [Reinekea blandensis]EAR11014.1 hypothetical protein MED297_10901 [Reinekea sp. MED297] [Reinekea blandensis MED297]